LPTYLLQASYSAESLAALIKKPQNRTEAVQKVIEKIGGKLVGLWLSFGDHDIVSIIEMPDNSAAAAFALAIASGGAIKNVKTTPLVLKMELLPGKSRNIRLQAGEVGRFRCRPCTW
jgi:uncharacterized protein with GYD domain